MLWGEGIEQGHLSHRRIEKITVEALGNYSLRGKRVLCLIPDFTRKAPIPLLFKALYKAIGSQVTALDFLVASGTHQPMPHSQIMKRLGLTKVELETEFPNVGLYAHVHDDSRELKLAGVIPEDEIREISDGKLHTAIQLYLNRRLFEYDLVIILGPVAPHEVAGFSGGNKYFFPGVAGTEIIQSFHWVGAVITNPVINGVKDNPVRRFLDRGAALLHFDKLCFSFVVLADGELGCLYIGSPEESYGKAVDYSSRVHIVYLERPFKRVIGDVPAMYTDLWVGGKAMYKLEPIVAEGGELIIYAPHIKELSHTHGAAIERIGYHVLDYFLEQWPRFAREPKLIMAHSTNVKGIGRYSDGHEYPRIKVTLATGIPEEVCRRVNLGYCDPATIKVEEWQNREDEGILYVPRAGELLYRLR